MRRPWLPFVVMAPLVVLFIYLAVDKWRDWHALGDAPREMTAAEALQEAQTGHTVWVKLTDARFVCEASGVFGEHRYAPLGAPSLLSAAPLLVEARGVACPPPGEPIVGVISSVTPAFFANISGALPARARAANEPPALVDLKGGAAKERLDFIIIVSFIIFFGLSGGIGYLVRRSETRLDQRMSGYVPTVQLVEALGRAPLRWRLFATAEDVVMTSFFGLVGLFVAYALYYTSADVTAAFIDEPRRWAGARPVATLGRPGVVYRSHVDFLDDILASIEISWQSPSEPGADPVRLSYGVFKVPEELGPVEVRVDDRGYLTNVGLTLASQRALSALVTGLPIMVFLGLSCRFLWRRRHEFAIKRATRRALLERPRPVLVPLLGQRIVRQYGFANGQRCYDYEAPSGASYTVTFGSNRRAALDEDGRRVLVVVPETDEDAEPIVVAEDGYPFVLAKSRR